jgi:hypothetical protein
MICNKCGHVFNIGEAAIKTNSYFGIDIPEKVCPQCGGGFRLIEIPKELDQYLFINDDDRYYTYTDKRKN